jgi:hypothetical protein
VTTLIAIFSGVREQIAPLNRLSRIMPVMCAEVPFQGLDAYPLLYGFHTPLKASKFPHIWTRLSLYVLSHKN